MTEILFYHLQRAPLERVLPDLLEKTLERGWRAVVQAGSEERVAALDSHLWTYRDESFLPHGTSGQDHVERQPIVLTASPANPNGATVRFMVDGAETEGYSDYDRVVYLFDGNDPDATEQARSRWKVISKSQEHELTYWQQNENGRWQKKA